MVRCPVTEQIMMIYWIGGVITVGLLVYLLVVLFKPELF
jgi:K+-transporting ATPase KdpF subunit